MEPSPKRIKLIDKPPHTELQNSTTNPLSFRIVSILSDELTKAVDTVNVYTSSITDNKSISQVILEVNKLLPAPALQHLKRVKKKVIMLCRVNDVANFIRENETFLRRMKDILPDLESKESFDERVKYLQDLPSDSNHLKCILSEYLKLKGFTSEMVEKLSSNAEIFPVPSIQPKLHWQYTIASDQWPCKFHLNKQLENLYNNNVFNENEKNFHIKLMDISLFISSNMNDKSVGVIVDPRNGHIVAVGGTSIDLHPLMHCSMVLIDLVSMTKTGN